MDSMLAERLYDLAREGSPIKQRQLLLELSDLVFAASAPRSLGEIAMFGEIAGLISSQLPVADRGRFADRIAAEPRMPRKVVFALGNDEIEVARVVLERSPALNDEDLCAIVEHRTEEHRVAVTGREALSGLVTGALARFGGEDVHVRLATHPNAVIAGPLGDMLQAVQAGPGFGEGASNAFSSAIVAQEVLKRVREKRNTLEAEIATLAERNLVHVIGHVLAGASNAKPEIAVRTLLRGRPETVRLLLKAAGSAFEGFRAVIAMQARQRKLREPDPEALRRSYETGDRASALRMISFVNLRQTVDLKGAA